MNLDRKKLIGIITEIEASRARAKAETTHQSEILKKAKADNFDTKAIRKVLQRRAMSATDRDSLDYAVDLYETAMGTLAKALEAVEEGRMSQREAAKHFDVPRGALGAVAGGPKTGFSSQQIDHPDHDPDTGEIVASHETAGNGGHKAPSDELEPGGEARPDTIAVTVHLGDMTSGSTVYVPLPAPATDTRTFDDIVGPIPDHLRRVP